MSNKLSKRTANKLSKLLENTGDMALKRRARKIIEEINPQEGEKILEIGCGDGYYLHILSSLGIKKLKLSGVDIDPNALKSARRNLKGRRISLKEADVMKKLPFAANSFDKVIMSEVCEHLSDDVKGLKEAKRVIKKGGRIVVTVPNHNYPMFWDPVNWFRERINGDHVREGFWAGLWAMHLRLYKPKELEEALNKANFNVEKVESTTWWCLPFNHNLMHFAALRLHSGELDENMAESIDKFSEKPSKRKSFIDVAFSIVNVIDSLNDLYQPKNSGVGVMAVASK